MPGAFFASLHSYVTHCCIRMLNVLQSCNSATLLRQLRLPHQIAIHLAGGTAPLVDGPDDEALAAPHVAGGKYAGDVGGVIAILGFGVGAGILLDAKLL